jgi:hypothetical protein
MSRKMLHQNWSEFDPEDGGNLLLNPRCPSARLRGITVQKATSATKLLWAHFEPPYIITEHTSSLIPPNTNLNTSELCTVVEQVDTICLD